MLARRIIAISPDKALGKQIATALAAAGGTVESHPSLDGLGRVIDAALVVAHVADELPTLVTDLMPRITGDTRLILVLPRANLAATVDLMQTSERVAGVMVAEDFTPPRLAAMATRVLAGDLFGLEKLMPWGTRIHSTLVGDYQEKSLAIAQLSELAEQMGVRRKYREAIEQCVDEMLMNALYDAPVDEHGKPLFAEIPTRSRIELRVEQKVVVQYACDGTQFAVSVRDAFGTLERGTVLRYLHKCLHSEQQIDRKTGGAGLGLYMMASNATRLLFNVLPGVATEAVVVCDLESPKVQLEELGFFTERIDAGGRLATGPVRRLPAGTAYPVERRAPDPRQRVIVGLLAATIAVLIAMIGIVAYPRLFGPDHTALTFTTDPPGATITIDGRARGVATGGTLVVDDLTVGKTYVVSASLDGHEPAQTVIQVAKQAGPVPFVLAPRAATVTVETDPPGAEIVIDGTVRGKTPYALAALAPGSKVAVTLHKDGYLDAIQSIDVPGPGKESRVVVPLALSPEIASVLITSEPPGARVLKNGEVMPGVTTPTDELLITAGQHATFMIELAGHVAEVIEHDPEPGSRRVALGATLVPGVTLTITANIAGTASVAGLPACKKLAVPGASCVVKPGAHDVSFEAPDAARASDRVTVRAGAASVAFSYGFVEARGGKKFRLARGGPALTKAAIEAGKRTVYVVDSDGGSVATPLEVKANKTSYVP